MYIFADKNILCLSASFKFKLPTEIDIEMFKYAVLGIVICFLASNVESLSRSRFERQVNNTNYYRPLGGVRWVEPRHQNKQHNSSLNRWGNQYQPPTGNVYNATRPGNIKPGVGWNANNYNTSNNYNHNNTNNYQRPANTSGFVDNGQRPINPYPAPQVTPTPVPVRPIATPATLPPTQPPFGSGYNANNNNNRGPYNSNVQLSYDVPSTPGRNHGKQPQQNIPSNNPWGRF